MSSNSPVGAVIVGAGPVGLALAWELARRSVPFRIIDRAPHPSATSKAIVLHARTLETLEMMGLVQPFVKKGFRIGGISIYAEGKCLLSANLSELDSPHNYCIDIPQSDTESILIEALAQRGVKVERPVELIGVNQDAGNVTLLAKHGDTGRDELIKTGYVIGCDGQSSKLRQMLNLPFEGTQDEQVYLLADVKVHGDIAPDRWHFYFHKRGLFLLFPLGNNRWRIVSSMQAPPEGELGLVLFQRLIAERDLPNLLLSEATWFAQYHVQHRKVEHYQVGRIFLAGDAAHVHSPAGGQGMNTGIQDAFNLGWKLAHVLKGKSPSMLLDSYNAEREPVGREVMALSDNLARIASMQSPLGVKVRDGLLAMLANLELFQDRILTEFEELRVNYRKSPRVAQHIGDLGAGYTRQFFQHGPKPGDRAPDAIITNAENGEPCRLFNFFQKGLYTLILFLRHEDNEADFRLVMEAISLCDEGYPGLVVPCLIAGRQWPSELRDLHARACLDARGGAHQAYGINAHGGLYLVRPDGYVGYRCIPSDMGHLRGYLAEMLLQPENATLNP